jgi:hypothetical protein
LSWSGEGTVDGFADRADKWAECPVSRSHQRRGAGLCLRLAWVIDQMRGPALRFVLAGAVWGFCLRRCKVSPRFLTEIRLSGLCFSFVSHSEGLAVATSVETDYGGATVFLGKRDYTRFPTGPR